MKHQSESCGAVFLGDVCHFEEEQRCQIKMVLSTVWDQLWGYDT